jgi:hypothetical protein
MIATLIYLIIGILLSIIWFKKEYEPEYKELKNSGEGVEKGMAELIMMFMAITWPIKLVYNLIKKKKAW